MGTHVCLNEGPFIYERVENKYLSKKVEPRYWYTFVSISQVGDVIHGPLVYFATRNILSYL